MDTSVAGMPHLRLLPAGPGRAPQSTRTLSRGSVIRFTPGDPRIGLALHAAQSATGSVVTVDSSSADLKTQPRTLDEIMAMEQHQGWSLVFRALKSQGLIEEQTLGHLVARWARRGGRSASPTAPPEAAPRAAPLPVPSRTASR